MITATPTINQTSASSSTSSNEKVPSDDWHALSPGDAATRLVTNLSRGLTQVEAGQRLSKHGPNQLAEVAESKWWKILLRQFTDVLTLVLFVACLASLFVGETIDAITIVAIIILNGLMGFVQEWKAEHALTALRAMLSPHCTVVRDGAERSIETRDVVVGDVVILNAGDRVPADLRLNRTQNVRVDESALTGESDSVSKTDAATANDAILSQRFSMAWMGTVVSGGRASGLVVATGSQTQFGQISTATENIAAATTPLQRNMAVLGKQLAAVAIAVATLIAVAGWLLGNPWREMLFTGISLAVAVVPEGLPAVVTLTMAFGIRAMVRRRALLRRLEAAETLGAATIVCTDKTGTLTQNEMTVKRVWLPDDEVEVTGVGYDPAGHFEVDGHRTEYQEHPSLLRLLKSGLHCNHASIHRTIKESWEHVGEPTECALVVAAYKAWLPLPDHNYDVAEFAFDSDRKRMTVVERMDDHFLAHVKGAPEVILDRCQSILVGDETRDITDADRADIFETMDRYATEGLRTLALARHTISRDSPLNADSVENELVLLGLVGMLDPPRPEASAAIQVAHDAGIRVIMITGDASGTANAIAKKVGLKSKRTMTGKELAQLSDVALAELLTTDVTFSRTTPNDKLRIVQALQANGHVVAMTGDGVNDAPALKRADIGVAMGLRGTDVAKGASDLVLMDDNFSSIIGAVEEGRRQYDNIRKFVRYLLSSNMGEVIAIFASLVTRGPLIFLPVQILWMNLVTDGVAAVALGMEPSESTVMRRPPRNPDAKVVDRWGLGLITILGAYVGLVTIAVYKWYLSSDDVRRVAVAQTVAFTTIILVQKANVLNFRSLTQPMKWSTFFSNPFLLIAIVATIAIHACAVYVPFLQKALHTQPLLLEDWGFVVAAAVPIFVVVELGKRVLSAIRG